MGLLAKVLAGRGGRGESRRRGGGVEPGWSPWVSLSGLLARLFGRAGDRGRGVLHKEGPGVVVSEEVWRSGGRAGLGVGEGGPAEGVLVGTCEASAINVPCRRASARSWHYAGDWRRMCRVEVALPDSTCESELIVSRRLVGLRVRSW